MKKIIIVVVAALVFLPASVPAGEITLNEQNFNLLIGKWEGYRRGFSPSGVIIEAPDALEVSGDSQPSAASGIYTNFVARGGGNKSYLFEGKIEGGKFFVKLKENKHWIRFSLKEKKGAFVLEGCDRNGWDLWLRKSKS